jgi:hypothetical protein
MAYVVVETFLTNPLTIGESSMKTTIFAVVASIIVLCGIDLAAAPAAARHTVVWDSQSQDSTGSMPLAGGNLGLNVWCEGDDLLFYIGHPDSRIENEKLVKLGRIRLTLSPSPFKQKFRQELDLAESCIRITGDGVRLKLWVDAFAPVVHVEMESNTPLEARIAYESWRFTAAPVADGLEWVYRLDPAKSDLPGKIRQQNLGAIADQIVDPLKNLTLGGRIVCPCLVADGTGDGVYMKTPFKSWKLKTAQPVTKLDLRVLLRVAPDESVDAWRGALDKLQQALVDRQKTLAWWQAFWNRSWIEINPGATQDDTGWQVGRNYELFRYILAANRTGKAPTLFNGGLFTFDNPLPNATAFDAAGPWPDERAWWGCLFMAQNQRWVYWPMLKTGDSDLLDIGLDFYRDRAALQEARARHLMGVEGTPFNESIDIYGLIGTGATASGHNGHSHLTYHYTSALEFAFMMVEECRFTGRAPASSLPTMLGMLKFYDSFYQQQCQKLTGKPLDDKGRLVIYPGNSCEQGVGCKNHSDAIGGLQAIAEGLLTLDIPAADRIWTEGFIKRIPPMPIIEKRGLRSIALAESWKSIANPNEFPQLYNLFPFHRYGVGLPDLEIARNTWKTGKPVQKESLCWKYGNTGVAMLGLADEAKEFALKKFLYPLGKDCQPTVAYGNCAQFKPRFPAFWATYPFDAFPDMDHGGTAMVGLQEMLLQTPGDRLLLLPAWPQAWDVDFKLHAPKNTTVECEVRAGKIVKLEVTPAARRKDVEIIGPLAPLPPPPPPPVPVSQGKKATASSVYHNPGYEADKAFDGNEETRWSMDNGQASGWLEVDLGRPMAISSIVIQEKSYPQTTRFAIEAQLADGSWKTLAEGGPIGEFKELEVKPTTAQRFRLKILESKLINAGAGATIDEFQLFE